MAKVLPLDDRLETAAQLVVRTKIFYDIWWYFEGEENRSKNIETMREYSEFFRFVLHAHFVSFIVHLAALVETRTDTINLRNLIQELTDANLISDQSSTEVEEMFHQIAPLAKKVIILRTNLFAHRSASLSYADAFKKAAVSSNELCELTEFTLKIVNRLLLARGLREHFFNTLPTADAEIMLNTLAQN